MHYSDQPRDQVSVNGYEFLSFVKNMSKNIVKNISKNVIGKYTQNFLIMLNIQQQMRLKLVQKNNLKEATGDLIGNKIADVVAKLYNGKNAKVSKNSPQNNSETVTNEHDKEIPKERYISPEERLKIIDLRLK